jgi:hypothetical protein
MGSQVKKSFNDFRRFLTVLPIQNNPLLTQVRFSEKRKEDTPASIYLRILMESTTRNAR